MQRFVLLLFVARHVVTYSKNKTHATSTSPTTNQIDIPFSSAFSTGLLGQAFESFVGGPGEVARAGPELDSSTELESCPFPVEIKILTGPQKISNLFAMFFSNPYDLKILVSSGLRMATKIKSVMDELEEMTTTIETKFNSGVVDGFDAK